MKKILILVLILSLFSMAFTPQTGVRISSVTIDAGNATTPAFLIVSAILPCSAWHPVYAISQKANSKKVGHFEISITFVRGNRACSASIVRRTYRYKLPLVDGINMIDVNGVYHFKVKK